MVVNMHEAKTHLSKLVQAALDGEEVMLARDGVPVARIQALKVEPRPFGWAGGPIWMAPDFNAPLTEEFQEYVDPTNGEAP